MRSTRTVGFALLFVLVACGSDRASNSAPTDGGGGDAGAESGTAASGGPSAGGSPGSGAAASGNAGAGECPEGYDDASGDGTACEDIDECADGTHDCGANSQC